jgi:hypothetical protein
MRLADEVHAEIQAFVSGRLAARDLEGWLDSAAPEIHAEGDDGLRTLTDRAFSLLAELSYGDRTVEDVRQALGTLVSTPPAGIVPARPRTEPISTSGTPD